MPLVSADVRWGGMRDEPKERLRRRLGMRLPSTLCKLCKDHFDKQEPKVAGSVCRSGSAVDLDKEILKFFYPPHPSQMLMYKTYELSLKRFFQNTTVKSKERKGQTCQFETKTLYIRNTPFEVTVVKRRSVLLHPPLDGMLVPAFCQNLCKPRMCITGQSVSEPPV